VRATGGEVGAASSLAPKIGPLGLSPKKVRSTFASAQKSSLSWNFSCLILFREMDPTYNHLYLINFSGPICCGQLIILGLLQIE